MDVFHWLTPFKNNLFAQVQVCNRGNDRAALREGTTRRSHKKEYAKPRTTLIAIPPEDPEDHMSFDQPNQTGKG